MVGNLTYGKKTVPKKYGHKCKKSFQKRSCFLPNYWRTWKRIQKLSMPLCRRLPCLKKPEEQQRQTRPGKSTRAKKSRRGAFARRPKSIGVLALLLSETLVQLGNENAITDALVAGMSARTAALGAIRNRRSISHPLQACDVCTKNAYDLRVSFGAIPWKTGKAHHSICGNDGLRRTRAVGGDLRGGLWKCSTC